MLGFVSAPEDKHTKCRTGSVWFQTDRRESSPPPLLRLFCFPHAGGGASVFRDWSQHLPVEVELCSSQLPGRENRWSDLPAKTLGELVEPIAAEILPLLDVPFVFLGHSMGSMLAFEIARALRSRTGLSPALLIVLAGRAPHLPDRCERVAQYPDDQFVRSLVRLNGIPAEVASSDELMKLLVPMLRADVSICESYSFRPDVPLECPLLAYGGISDHRVSCGEVYAWRLHTTGPFQVRFFPGGHFFQVAAQDRVLAALSADLGSMLVQMREMR